MKTPQPNSSGSLHPACSLTVEEMVTALGLQLCDWKGEGCDSCETPSPDARIYVQMSGGEASYEASFYVCEHCLPEKHAREVLMDCDNIEWAEYEAEIEAACESENVPDQRTASTKP